MNVGGTGVNVAVADTGDDVVLLLQALRMRAKRDGIKMKVKKNWNFMCSLSLWKSYTRV